MVGKHYKQVTAAVSCSVDIGDSIHYSITQIAYTEVQSRVNVRHTHCYKRPACVSVLKDLYWFNNGSII